MAPTSSIRPTRTQASSIDLIVYGSHDAIMMVEAGAKEVTEEQMVGALDAAHRAIRDIVEAIDDLKPNVGKRRRRSGQDDRPVVRSRYRGRLRTARCHAPQGQVGELLRVDDVPGWSRHPGRPAPTARRGEDHLQRPQRRSCATRFSTGASGWMADGSTNPSDPIETGVARPRFRHSRAATQALVSATLGTERCPKIDRWKARPTNLPATTFRRCFRRCCLRAPAGAKSATPWPNEPSPARPRKPNSLHASGRLRYPRVERSSSMASAAVAPRVDGRGRPAQSVGRWGGDGPRDE